MVDEGESTTSCGAGEHVTTSQGATLYGGKNIIFRRVKQHHDLVLKNSSPLPSKTSDVRCARTQEAMSCGIVTRTRKENMRQRREKGVGRESTWARPTKAPTHDLPWPRQSSLKPHEKRRSEGTFSPPNPTRKACGSGAPRTGKVAPGRTFLPDIRGRGASGPGVPEPPTVST